MSSTRPTIDPITLEVLWNRLIAVVNEQAAALMRTSFTTVVRESGDLSAGVFDLEGRMLEFFAHPGTTRGTAAEFAPARPGLCAVLPGAAAGDR